MSGSYGLAEKHQKAILKMLKEIGVDTDPLWRNEDEDGVMRPFHKNVSIQVCNFEDESEEFSMYVMVD